MKNIWAFMIVLLFGWLVFYQITQLSEVTDMSLHIQSAEKMSNGQVPIPSFFIFYLFASIPFVLSLNYFYAQIFISFGLAVALVAKFYVTKRIIVECFKGIAEYKSKIYKIIVLLIPSLLLLQTNMPSKPFWEYVLPPISWHNSTVIFVFPASLLLFWYSYKLLVKYNNNYLVKIILTGTLVLLIKPNYILVFIVVYPIFLFFQNKFTVNFIKGIIPVIVFILVLAIQYIYTYEFISKNELTEHYNNVKLFIEPFHAWNKISGNIILSYLAWTLYPTLFYIFYFKDIKESLLYNYSFLNYVVAFLIFIMFTEKHADGTNIGAVNFLWQVIICVYVHFLITLVTHIKILVAKQKVNYFDVFLGLTFIYYPFSGVMYLLRTVFNFF